MIRCIDVSGAYSEEFMLVSYLADVYELAIVVLQNALLWLIFSVVLAFTVCFCPPVQVILVIVRSLMRYGALVKNDTHPVLLRHTYCFLASVIRFSVRLWIVRLVVVPTKELIFLLDIFRLLGSIVSYKMVMYYNISVWFLPLLQAFACPS